MIYMLGHPVAITTDKVCQRSGDDHVKLVHEARKDRRERNFNVEESYVLCLRCGKGLSLK